MKESFEISGALSNSSQDWLLVRDLYLNYHFFKRGMLLVTPNVEHQKNVSNEEKSFKINDREFMFYTEGCLDKSLHAPKRNEVNKTKKLLNSLINFANINYPYIGTSKEKSRILFNKFRKNEIFLPLLLDHEEDSTGLYVYPWIAQSKTIDFSGFNQFVTAGCMFGAAIKGHTKQGECIELINHRLHLQPGDKIISIAFDISAENPFEDILFHEFQTACQLIKTMAIPDEPPYLLYHLPDIDYIMFGIKLFIYEQMSLYALETFIRTILVQRERHQTILRSICRRHNISITFDTPFCNLLSDIDVNNPVQSIINHSWFNIQDIMSLDTLEEREHQFTAYSLLRLTSYQYNENHALAWQDFIKIEPNPPRTIEELFKIGNAVMIATASRKQQDYKTCSLLPLSEKQIPLMYDQFRTKFTRLFSTEYSRYYPATVNLTLFDPVITYSPTTKGLLFYFACCLPSLSFLIKEKKLIEHAGRNLSLFAKNIKKNHETLGGHEQLVSKPIELGDIFIESSIIPGNPT